MEKFEAYADFISNKLKEYDVTINNTICDSTRLRQEEVEKMSKTVEYMIIIGGKNSANTQKLYNYVRVDFRTCRDSPAKNEPLQNHLQP